MRAYATVRADGESIRLGANAFLAERATLHIADSLLGVTAGDDVTLGRFALVHACSVEDRVVVGDTAVVMDGAHVGAGALIAAGSLVPPRKRLPGGWIYEGNPATPSRAIDAAELADAAAAIRAGGRFDLTTAADLPAFDAIAARSHAGHQHVALAERAYVAPTALVAGDVSVADDASVFFGCVVIGAAGRVSIGPRTNVQDNTLIVAGAGGGEVRIGADVTIGHNVRMGAALIDDDALIGMGSQLADGVHVERGGCVGARAWVESGTVVEAGWIWAGRPARAFRRVKPEEREWFAQGAAVYVRYARAYLADAAGREARPV